MAKERGTQVLLKVGDGASPEVFTSLAGQQSTEMNINGNPIDTSDKTTNDWGTALQGIKNMTITCSGQVSWPDTAGLERLRSQMHAGNTVNCRIVLNTAGANYEGAFSITDLSITGDRDNVTSYSLTLQNAAEPTYASSES